MAGVDAEEARGSVEHLRAVGLEVVAVPCAGKEARALLEGAVRRERDPIGFKLVGFHIEGCHGILRRGA
jgi:hypothetical protein